MRIGLNLLHALQEIGGGWNYIASLVRALGEHDHNNTYVAFVNSESASLVPRKANFVAVSVGIQAKSRAQRVMYENTMLQLLARRYRLDCMHWFANTQALVNAVPAVVTIHDLQPFLDYASFPLIKRSYLRLMMAVTCRRAPMLLPISNATARDLQQVLKADRDRMAVIPAVVDSRFKPVDSDKTRAFKATHMLPERFWLYVAHMYPHKNHVRLLEAYHRLKLSGYAPWSLVLRGDPKGAEHRVADMIRRLGLEHDVLLLPRLNERELPQLYSAATALVFPSLYEGAGIPVVEAMASACPVVASDIPPIREFAGEAVSYFDPLDPASIASAMMNLQCDPGQQERSRLAGLAKASEFRAPKIVDKLLNAYAKTVDQSGVRNGPSALSATGACSAGSSEDNPTRLPK